MSLATRCPACQTTFRVVQDQLKVSEGWVRCGRCNEVFNALEGLFDLERDSVSGALDSPPAPDDARGDVPGAAASHDTPPPAGPPPAAPHSQAEFLRQPESGTDSLPPPAEAPAAAEDDTGNTPQTAYEVLDSRFLDRSTYGPSRLPDSEGEFADARFDSSFHGEHGAGDGPAEPLESERVAAAAAAEASARGRKRKVRSSSAQSEAPEFLRQADRQARWSRRPVRVALGMLALLLCLTLTAQVGLHHRDWLAAHHPQSRPWLDLACGALGCRIEALRSIDDVVIDSSSLARAGQSNAYRLSVSLRNRSGVTVAVPSIDLTLTDTNGELVARRMLSPTDFRAATALRAGGELALSLDLQSPGQRIAGYTVEAFYP